MSSNCHYFYISNSIGVVAFIGLASFLLSRPSTELQLQEKLVFACFFVGAITCMGLSFLYHTLCCNENKRIGRLFAKYVSITTSYIVYFDTYIKLWPKYYETILYFLSKLGSTIVEYPS